MDNEYFETLEECRKDTENGAKVLIEHPIYDSGTGEIDMFYSLAKKNDKYTGFMYFKVKGRWCGDYYNSNIRKYQDTEEFIVLLCKNSFRDEHRRMVGMKAKYLR